MHVQYQPLGKTVRVVKSEFREVEFRVDGVDDSVVVWADDHDVVRVVVQGC